MELITLGRAAKQAWESIRHHFLGQEDVSEQDVLELYARAHTVYNCANVRAQNVARVPMRAVNLKGEPVQHEVNAVFADTSNYFEIAEASEMALSFVGTNLLIPQTNFLGDFVATSDNLRWVHPSLYSRVETPQDGLVRFRFNWWGTGHEPLKRPDIPAQYALYMHQFDFRNEFDGVAWGEVAFFAGSAQHEKWQTVWSYFVNRAIPASILQDAADSKLPIANNLDAPEQLRKLLDRLFSGSRNAGKTLVSPSRLEYIQVQQDMDKMALEKLSPEIRKAIHAAAQVPEVLANFNAATYDNADAAINFWLRYWLVPRCEWYARQYSNFFSRWYGETLLIRPDFSGILESEDNTERINAQVGAGYMDLYTAQVEAGLEPDLSLKGLYMVPGIGPVPAVELPNLWRSKVAVPAPVDAGVGTFAVDHPNPPLLAERNPFVPDDVFGEIKMATRKGASFVPDKLPAVTAQYMRVLSEQGLEQDTIIRAAKAQYMLVHAAKAIQATRVLFEDTFADILASARAEDINRRRAGTLVRAEIGRFIELAFADGLKDGGVDDAALDDEDRELVNNLKAAQSAFVTDFLNTVYKTGISDDQAAGKPEQWFNGSVYPAYIAGLQSAAGNMMMRWSLGRTEKHCRSCLALNGQVHRLKDFINNGFYPKSDALICGPGKHCDCTVTPAPGEKASGRLRAVPKLHGAHLLETML